MIRFVLSPDGDVVPDVAGKLPGRGVWVSADRASLEIVIEKNLFSRGFKTKVKPSEYLLDMTTTLLSSKVLGLLTMANKSGQIKMGFDQVKTAAQSEPLSWRVEASDGSEDGRGKIRVLARAVAHELERPQPRVLGCFTSEDLGKAVGRDYMVHAALLPGSLSKSLGQAADRLSGFVDLIPAHWPDVRHERPKKSPEKGGIRS